ncbi:hydrogenase-4 subunit J [Yersinia frederiksenii]|uniref:formate hydrogenlyase maturation HycH family protein n=1 Tax=Yersinia alsatica TaxID=2890317 RepID=UPI0005E998AA|nr:formate hydrogenlyase maturation HycH family protein [Yersinia alsatica]CNH28332.1 hydrogenase-4 subunit J [Yersinia frederiksenii]CNK52030.1 hydrogenase-4 subunit J [Yersinia frederiksenii]
MSAKVIFYALNQKFLDSDDDMPEQAQQVMYYSLAIGHHVGVIDCLKAIMECPLAEYQQWFGQLPEGEAHRKMAGLLKFGEITIDSTHTQLLAQAFAPLAQDPASLHQPWSQQLLQTLYDIEQEPAIYLMVKRRP